MTHDSKLITPLIVIVGETGSGKSQLAMELARRFNGEIICADSWTVYRGFDIGTAKSSSQERELVKHHLLDIVDAKDGFNAALFKRLALDSIADIESRGKLPILAGGTGLYIDSVLYDFSFLPVATDTERAIRNNLTLSELLTEAATIGIDLEGIDIRNKRRVIRALETGGQRPSNTEMRSNTLVIGVRVTKDDLRQRITNRVNNMFAAGLEQEVKTLKVKYGWGAEPMKGIGYREWREYYEGHQNIEVTKERIISASMNLAKRQRTWFKRNNSIHWVNDPLEAVELATMFLNKKQ